MMVYCEGVWTDLIGQVGRLARHFWGHEMKRAVYIMTVCLVGAMYGCADDSSDGSESLSTPSDVLDGGRNDDSGVALDGRLGVDVSAKPDLGMNGDVGVLCSENEHVRAGACVACPAGTTNAAADDASGDDTVCDATLCGEHEFVLEHVCVACPAGTTNAAADDASRGRHGL